MKKFLLIALIASLFVGTIFAETYSVKVTGKVYIVTEDLELIQLNEKDEVSDSDTIFVDEESSIKFFVNGSPYTVRKTGKFNVLEKLKSLGAIR